jgi:hypothetical protein
VVNRSFGVFIEELNTGCWGRSLNGLNDTDSWSTGLGDSVDLGLIATVDNALSGGTSTTVDNTDYRLLITGNLDTDNFWCTGGLFLDADDLGTGLVFLKTKVGVSRGGEDVVNLGSSLGLDLSHLDLLYPTDLDGGCLSIHGLDRGGLSIHGLDRRSLSIHGLSPSHGVSRGLGGYCVCRGGSYGVG